MRLDTSAGDARMEAAEAKRARKAAKRRRDAALTALGQQASEARVVSNALVWRMSGPLGDVFHLADEYEDDCRMTMRQIRRGEVVPAESPVWFGVAS